MREIRYGRRSDDSSVEFVVNIAFWISSVIALCFAYYAPDIHTTIMLVGVALWFKP